MPRKKMDATSPPPGGTRAKSKERLARLKRAKAEDSFPTTTGDVKYPGRNYGEKSTKMPRKVRAKGY